MLIELCIKQVLVTSAKIRVILTNQFQRERGERSPSFEVIIDLANALGVPPTDLINFDSTDQPLTNTALSVVSPNSIVDPIEEPIKGKEQRKTDIERLQAALNSTIPLQKLAMEYGKQIPLYSNINFRNGKNGLDRLAKKLIIPR